MQCLDVFNEREDRLQLGEEKKKKSILRKRGIGKTRLKSIVWLEKHSPDSSLPVLPPQQMCNTWILAQKGIRMVSRILKSER